MKNKDKTFWKLLAIDYASFLIHPASYMVSITTDKFKKILGVKNVAPTLFESIGEKNDKQRFHWCLVEKDFARHAKIILSKLNESPSFFKEINNKSRTTINKARKYALWLFRQNFSQYSNAKLKNIFLKLFDLLMNMNMWGQLINLADFEHNMLTNKIMGFLERRVKEHNYKLSMPEAFGILTTPIEKNPLQKQEEDFYKLLSLIQENKKSVDKVAEEHKRKYDWLEFHYSGPTILSKEYFIELLVSEIKQGTNGKEKLKELRNKKRELDLKQKKISKELNLSNEELYWINIAKTFMFLKALRKDIVFQISRLTNPFVKEIAKRLKLTLNQTRNMTIDELKKGLEGKKINKNLINQRIVHCIWLIKDERVNAIVGKKAREYAKRIIEEKVEEGVNEFKGTPACVGHVKGAAKIIIGADDMSKMNKGDILVSPATNPNLLTAMKKAGAIITDEGGITCHAAIVSRELNIPCIIGTKIATKVLRDGDLVEVDADKGMVRVLKK